MENWSVDFSKMLEAMVKEVEQFLTDTAKDISEAVDAFVEASEEIVAQMQTTFEAEIEPRINEFLDPILEAYLGFEIVVEETTQPVVRSIEPFLNEHPACVGCRHYHGQSYGGTMLVCGMHPYGWEGEKCPDWQSTWLE
ncbi:hypothetical protein K9N68_30120 [Kovacikia minuta CCNUW1]|uniref:hypothetical protein n=1 Tax=Kovacikia minuta TaxID=2931930 RepID=UPI001CCE3AAD|nr:hypothetical protein [Kovacikia minuta]UBF25759.1 hypothetical protein K9N68_30120 [Kovacikia minuta CCNUW1]